MSRISGAHHQGDPSGGASGEGLPRGHRGDGQPRGVIVTVVFGGVVGRAGPEAGGARRSEDRGKIACTGSPTRVHEHASRTNAITGSATRGRWKHIEHGAISDDRRAVARGDPIEQQAGRGEDPR